jgi:hypothetical protein
MALTLIVPMKSHRGQKLYVSGPITSKNGTKTSTDQKDFFCRFRLSSRTIEKLLEKIEEAISYPTNR